MLDQSSTEREDVKKERHTLLFACSLTRGLYLELLPDLTTDEFLGSLKSLMARSGKPNKIYSDFGKTFIAAAK